MDRECNYANAIVPYGARTSDALEALLDAGYEPFEATTGPNGASVIHCLQDLDNDDDDTNEQDGEDSMPGAGTYAALRRYPRM